MTIQRAWWKEAIVYQIYPQSFNDSTGDVRQTDGLTSQPESHRLSGDGVGDLAGIVEKLDYLDELGVDVVWLNPVYESPHHDDGYDVSDYRAIREEYGTMDEWEALLDGLHDRDMKLIMDLVVNHTSDEHEWFVAAREGEPEYEDYYVWKDGERAENAADSPGPADREPPNNWTAAFGGSAWAWDEEVGQYYLHLFDEHQPDLDWENETVREEVFEMMNWWLEKGIDGFRMDVINLISKPQAFPDGDPDEEWVGVEHFSRGPRLQEYLEEIHDRTLDGRDAMTVGEMAAVQLDDARDYVGTDGPLDMVFHFDHVTLDYDDEDGWWTVVDWDLRDLKRVVTEWQTELDDGWNAVYLGNHDQPRIVSRFGDDGDYREESAKLLATYLLTLRGTPFVFQGDEIGMTNYPWETLDEQEDAQTVGRVEAAIEDGDIEGFEEVKELVRYRSRDNARTPMQWDASENAGFTTGDPWLPVNPNHDEVNVAAERDREGSVLDYYTRLVDLRHDVDALVYGEYELLLPDDEQVFAYTRTLADEQWLIALNFSAEPAAVDLPLADADRVVGNYDDAGDRTELRPYEARVYRR